MTAAEDDRLARVQLSCALEPGHALSNRLAAQLGPVELLARLRRPGGDPEVRQASEDIAARLAEVDAVRTLERADARGIRFVVPDDPEWPTQLDDLEHGAELYQRGGVPVGLWVRGSGDLRGLSGSAVAVVGSRSCTTYGAEVARDISAGVAGAGYTVVSGGAFGIDQAAHRAALTVQGATVAVLACGVDRAYPEAHRELLDYIAEAGGVLVSESAPGAAPTRIRFLARNRIIAALAGGTVVVEAAVRSGALNTASWAGGLGRQLMGVPGPVTSAASDGVHQLVRSRGALLVTRAEEVLEAVGPVGAFALADPREPARPRDSLTHAERQVLDAVPVLSAGGVHNIARVAGLAPERTARALDTLHRAGLVERSGDRWRLRQSSPPPVAPAE